MRLTQITTLILCTAFAATGQATVKIMPLGDSITQGRHPTASAYKNVASYRYFLWHQLQASDRCVDFVGSQTTPNAPAKPQYNNFDKAHEGHWGMFADQMAANARSWCATYQPDIVLLHAGSVDTYYSQTATSTIADIGNIIDELRAAKSDVTILVAKLIPFGPALNRDVGPVNALIPGLIANKNNATSQVIAVDHFTGWNTNVHTFDQVHPYEAGEVRMANTWHNVLTTLIAPCTPVTPVASFTGSPTTGILPHSVNFTESSSNWPTSWLWSFGDGGTSSDRNPSHTYTTAGSFTVSLTASNAAGGNTQTRTNYVVVQSPVTQPVADFSGTPTLGNAPLSVTFTDLSSNTPTSWAWNFGDGGTSNQRNPSHVYGTPGTYTVTLTATNSAGSDNMVRTNYIAALNVGNPPVANFSGSPLSGTSPLVVSFADASTNSPTSWFWNFGDGGTSVLPNPTHTYNTAGVYTVSLTAFNAAGQDAEVKSGYISVSSAGSPPIAAFSGTPTSGTAPLAVSFSDSSANSPTSWFWNFGDGTTSTLRNPNHSYGTAGTYTVSLTASNAFGSDAETKTNYVAVTSGGSGGGGDPTTIRIMPLGDSITEARNGQASYRYFFWKKLIADGRCVDFVGSLSGTRGATANDHDGIPKYQDFDWDHEGHWGFRADEIAANAYNWASAAAPDIVICHVGSNDVLQGQSTNSTIADIRFMIDELRRAVPRVKIYLARIIPFGPSFPFSVSPLNSALPSLVASKSTSLSPIVLVDHNSGWNNSIHSIDDVHPNEVGENRMASVWHSAMLAQQEPLCKDNSYKIMPMGDSITASSNGWASYRYFLWHQLIQSGHCVNFVGSKTGVRPPGTPKYDDFDADYEGGWGLRADQLAANAFNWANAEQPDLVLVHAGIDDIYIGQSVASTIADLGLLIDELRRAKPDVTIMMAQVNPFSAGFNVDVVPLNNAIPGLVTSKNTAQSPVILVDHYTGWNTNIHTYNGIHSNQAGEIRMANTWHTAIQALSLQTCGSPPIAQTTNIMPLGDSITASSNGFASYRYYLWHQLQNSGQCVEFVGSKSGVRSGSPKFSDFDQDYEGGWGLRADQIAAGAYNWAVAAEPDVVLLHAGIDDVYIGQSVASTIADLGLIVDELRRANPSVKVLMAQLNPFGAPFTMDVVPLNNAIPGLALSKSTAQSPVIVVDHFTGWNTSIHTFNGIHSNQAGEIRMANTWHNAIMALNLSCFATLKNGGAGCPGTAGIPTLSTRHGSRPIIGQQFYVNLGSLPASAPVVGIIGFHNKMWNGAQLPFDLGGLGMPGCSLMVSPDILEPMTANQTGRIQWTLPLIPGTNDLAGDEFYLQAFVQDPGANHLGGTVTNSAIATFGLR